MALVQDQALRLYEWLKGAHTVRLYGWRHQPPPWVTAPSVPRGTE